MKFISHHLIPRQQTEQDALINQLILVDAYDFTHRIGHPLLNWVCDEMGYSIAIRVQSAYKKLLRIAFEDHLMNTESTE